VAAVQRLTAEVRLNVSARAVDDGSGNAAIVRAVRPVSAMPMSQVERMDDTTFYNVVPGTHLNFQLDLDPSRIMPTDVEQQITIRIEFLSDGHATLGYRDVTIVIPARGQMCPAQ
jgi:hypothetical protein